MLPGEDASSKAEEAATRRALLDRGSGVPMALDRQHVFLDAAKAREWATVRHTLEGTPELINVQPAGRWSALHQAAEAGDEATIQHLLGHSHVTRGVRLTSPQTKSVASCCKPASRSTLPNASQETSRLASFIECVRPCSGTSWIA